MRRPYLGLGFSWLLALGGLVGCGSGDPNQVGANGPGASHGFESDDPSAGGSGGPGFGGGEDAGAAPEDDGASDAERDIAEADIVQRSGHRLYALSRSGGLSVIDIGKRDKLTLLGRFRIQATPFEMYLRGDIVVAMFSDYDKYVYDEATKTHKWISTSEIVALDASDPKAIRELAHFELPGAISDSRVVGDILYAVSFENGDCWGCGSEQRTMVTSIDLSDKTSFRKVAELAFPAKQNQYGWGKRSVTVTPKRMYVAGPEWKPNGTSSSTIQVVDIEDPHGSLTLGKRVEATGTISSRWQMDEHEGVLRVISQPDQWDLSKPPRVQTFEVSDDLKPLGSLDLTLPRPEQLRSVRFDGARGYAITFERTDPLFTIDLSNPAHPVQKGELEMPGWVHHMEPRGDRLYGLGFDNGNKEGSLNVSIFDVSDLSKPTMLDRVNFGGNWSSLGEDQDRIHKAFQILPDSGLILVPFSGYTYSQGYDCGSYTSGVQLIDLAGDSLKKRGVAPSRGEPRRGFLHDDRLFTISEERAEVFDIGNRDNPQKTASMKLAHRVDRLVPAGDKLVRLAIDWWNGQASLEVVREREADVYEPLGAIDLEAALSDSAEAQCPSYGYFYYARVFAHGNHVYVLVPPVHWQPGNRETTVLVVDIEDAAAPRVISKKRYPFSVIAYETTGQGSGFMIEAGASVVQIGSTIALLDVDYGSSQENKGSSVHVLDFKEADAPRHAKVDLEAAKGRTWLQVYGDTLMLGRHSSIPDKPSKVRFYVDRVDVSNPGEPRVLPSINVPGSLLSYDPESNRLITVDYQRETIHGTTWHDCTDGGSEPSHFDYPTSTCTKVHRSLELVQVSGDVASRIESKPLAKDLWVSRAARGDDRVYLLSGSGYWGYSDCGYGCGGTWGNRLEIIGGARAGRLEVVSHLVDEVQGIGRMEARGQKLLVSGDSTRNVAIVDSRQLASISTKTLGSLRGYAYDLAVSGERAYVALGEDGVQTFDVPR